MKQISLTGVKFSAIVALTAFLTPACAFASGPGTTNDFGGKRVLIIGIDGCRSDALQAADAPNIRALIADGVTTWTGTAGGELNGVTQQPTISGPGWTTMLTGQYINIHGVTGNATTAYDTPGGYQVSQAPHFAKRLKDTVPTSLFSSVVSWNWIEDYLVAAQPANFGYHTKGVGAAYPDRDLDVKNKVIAHLAIADPDVLFVHFDQVDGAGHATGFDVGNPAYMAAIHTVDGHVGAIVSAIRSRPQHASENWLIIVSTDHGGTAGGSHGGQSVGERTIPIIVSGKSVGDARIDATTLGHHIIPAITFKHLGLPADPAWQPGVFGFPPYLGTETAGNAIHLRWELPAGGLTGLTSIEVRRGGNLLQTLPATAREYTDFPNPPAGSTSLYEVSFLGAGEVRTATVTLPVAPDIASDLVLHLPFEGNGNDVSGRGNTATPVGATYITDGRFGSAATLNATSSFNLGQPADLKFGATTDFSISVWVRAPSAWTQDPSLISNKNWDSGSNTGWIIAGAPSVRAWQWNFKGVAVTRKDFDPAASASNLADGSWHLITVTHRRDANAVFYHDGVKIGEVSIAGGGEVDTASDIRIGRDGANGYAFSADVAIDDLKIWRRALAPADVAALVQAGTGQTGFDSWRSANFTQAQLASTSISGPLADPDGDGVSNLMEFASGNSPQRPGESAPLEILGNELRWAQLNGGVGKNGSSYTAAGVRYRIETSLLAASGTWQDATPFLVETDAPLFVDAGVHWPRLRVTSQDARRFFRLSVTKP